MKKYLLIAATACVALAACTKNEVRPVSTDQEITFETAVYKASSKALISTATYPNTASFGTVAYRESSGNPKYFGPEEVSYNNDIGYINANPQYVEISTIKVDGSGTGIIGGGTDFTIPCFGIDI